MTRDLDLGFLALTDCAPLIVAHERGYFADEGLRVTLHREVSWATVRDKLAAGLYQGAHLLAPMVLAGGIGAGSERADFLAPLSLNAHGAALGVSSALAEEVAHAGARVDAAALARVAADRRAAGRPAISFAVVFPYSMHNYMLRSWLAAAGLDPDRDVRIVTAPPTAIAARLGAGEIDGFCVGAPWGALCEDESGARILLDAGEFWPGGPDKVLALPASWAQRDPSATLALTRAVLRGALWADEASRADELAALLARADYVGAPAPLIARKLGAAPTSIGFARAAQPNPAHAAWILSQMLRWGQAAPDAPLERALGAYRPDLYAAAAQSVGAPLPTTAQNFPADDRAPGDLPAALRDYAAAYAITRVKA